LATRGFDVASGDGTPVVVPSMASRPMMSGTRWRLRIEVAELTVVYISSLPRIP
jgi:hypothetical protein